MSRFFQIISERVVNRISRADTFTPNADYHVPYMEIPNPMYRDVLQSLGSDGTPGDLTRNLALNSIRSDKTVTSSVLKAPDWSSDLTRNASPTEVTLPSTGGPSDVKDCSMPVSAGLILNYQGPCLHDWLCRLHQDANGFRVRSRLVVLLGMVIFD
jgi:hypothetical protein